jgi:hypothetical protein
VVSVVKNGLPGTGGEHDHATLFQMPDRPQADVRLGQLLHRDRRLDAGGDTDLLERIPTASALMTVASIPM